MTRMRSRLAAPALLLAMLVGGSVSAGASVPRFATPAGYSLVFRGARQGHAAGGTVKGCAFDPFGFPEFAVRWDGFTVRGVRYTLYLVAAGSIKAGDPIPITRRLGPDAGATLRISSGNRTFDKPLTGSVELSPDGIGLLDAVLGPKVNGKPLKVHGSFVCLVS